MTRDLARAATIATVTLLFGCGGNGRRAVVRPQPAPPTPLTRDAIAFLSDADGQPNVWLLDPADSARTRVTNDAAPELYPVISPDSAWIAFMETVGGRHDVFVVGVDGTNERNVTNDSGADDGPPRWSADGSWIYYTHGIPGSPSRVDVYKIRPDGSDPTPVTQDGATTLLDVRRDGGKVLAQRYTGLWTMDPDGSSQTLLDTAAVFTAEYAPAGDRIAYAATSPGGAKDVYVLPLGGTTRTNVTNGAFDASWSPTWSPDASQIVFHASDAGQTSQLYVIAPDGNGLAPVTQGPGFNGEAYWGPK